MGRRLVLTVFGVLASIAIGTTAWDLGAGEDIFWGLPEWIGLAIIAFAAWWFPRTIVEIIRQPEKGPSSGGPQGRSSSLLSFVPVLVALLIFALGWVLGR